MNKIVVFLLAVFGPLIGFLIGLFVRQPKINELKKRLDYLLTDNEHLKALIEIKRVEYNELLIQHKALKAIQLKKKRELEGKLSENLILQYALFEYLTLLVNRGRQEKKLSRDEKAFYNAFDGVIEGKALSEREKVTIFKHIQNRYAKELKEQKECEYSAAFPELQLDIDLG